MCERERESERKRKKELTDGKKAMGYRISVAANMAKYNDDLHYDIQEYDNSGLVLSIMISKPR